MSEGLNFFGGHELPHGWIELDLSVLRRTRSVTFNPEKEPTKTLELYSVPSYETGKPEIVKASDIGSNKQYVEPGDVLISKINPRLNRAWVVGDFTEYNKIASTEWIVFAKNPLVESKLLQHILTDVRIRDYLAHNASGVGGSLMRVKPRLMDNISIGLPPEKEQRRIVAKVEELFSELDNGIESLKTAREQLKVYRQAVLKHAFEGSLTEHWREENKDKLETADQLRGRIKEEREARYQQQFEEWKAAVESWEAKGKSGKKPSKPKKPADLTHLQAGDVPELPSGWIWVRYGDLCSLIRNGISKKPEGNSGAKIFRISAVRPMEFDLDDVRYIAHAAGEFDDYYLQHGDLVFTRYNGSRAYVGVCAEYKADGSHLYPDKLIRTHLATGITLSGYIEKAVNCGKSRKFIEERIRTTAGQSGISGSDIRGIPVPLCSPTEQAIIQDRVDEELSNISQLLSRIEEDLRRSEVLRQSILKKAFSAQLVEQDPSDEPASVLLDRIKAQKAAQEETNKKNKSRS